MTEHVLDRPAVSTLTGRQGHLAVRHGGALRMHPDFGLFAGVELCADRASAAAAVRRLIDAGVLTKDTHRNTVRLAPPLIITENQIDWVVDRLAQVLDDMASDKTSVASAASA